MFLYKVSYITKRFTQGVPVLQAAAAVASERLKLFWSGYAMKDGSRQWVLLIKVRRAVLKGGMFFAQEVIACHFFADPLFEQPVY